MQKQIPENVVDYREFMFKNMELRKIMKENHNQPITKVILNKTSKELETVVATVGKNQANIYDNAHVGEHLDIFVHYVNEITPYNEEFTRKFQKGDENPALTLSTCCWVQANDPDMKDMYLVVGGEDLVIHVLSIARVSVICELEGHTSKIIDIKTYDSKIVSLSSDGTVKVWQIEEQKTQLKPGHCIATYQDTKINCLAINEKDNIFVGGGQKGELKIFELPNPQDDQYIPKNIANYHVPNVKYIDCVSFIGISEEDSTVGSGIVYKTFNEITYLEVQDFKSISPENVHLKTQIKGNPFCGQFDISSDGNFICCGNRSGLVYIYNIITGKNISTLNHGKHKSQINCAIFSTHCKYVLYTNDDGVLWRFDYVQPTPKTENDDENKENENKINQ